MSLTLLYEALQARRRAEEAAGQKMFLGIPDRWYDDPHWRCSNHHVSTMYLKSEVSGDLCLKCFQPVYMTFPEDRDGPLARG